MTRSCPSCHADARIGARFCDQCGTRLPDSSGATARSELRLGTLLFCDLVQSTDLANRLDPDDLRLVFASFQRAVRQVSWRHDGYLVRFVGDGAFIVFGYPTVREDSALSAVEAGLELVAAVRTIALGDGRTLELRVGIASGQVVMGEMIGGAAVGEQPVTGVTTHLAARLAAEARPGTVLACDDTQSLVGQQVNWQPVGPLALKGFPALVTAWQATKLAAPISRFDAIRSAGSRSDLVGRDDALLELSRQWSEVVEGRGRGVLLTGDAGLGKSHLARAALQAAQGQQALYLDLHCSPRHQLSPLHPVSAALRRIAGIEATDDDATAQSKAELLLRALWPDERAVTAADRLRTLFHLPAAASAASPADSPEMQRERMLAQLVDLVLALAGSQPVFLLVEDLHWSDPSTEALLMRVLEQASSQRILVLATARAGELKPALVLPHTTTLALEPLGAEHARDLVARRSRGQTLPAAMVDDIVARADGIPLYLEELALAARSGFGALGGAETDGAAERLPTSLQSLIQSKLDRMPDLKPALQAAAVMGREFHWPLLRRVIDDDTFADTAVARLVDLGLLVPTESASSARLRFKHALIHDAVYETLLRSDRQRLHSRVADLLGTGLDEPESSPELLAHHLTEAARFGDAVSSLLQASQRMAQRAAYQESMGHARAGLSLVDQVPDLPTRRNLRLLLQAQLGVPLTALMGYAAPEVEQTYAAASDLCDEQTPIAILFPVLRGLAAYYLVRGQIDRSDRLAQQCLAIAHRMRDPALTIDALSFLAYPTLYLGRVREAHDFARQGAQLYEQHGGHKLSYAVPQDPGTAALSIMTTTAWFLGDFAGADQAAQRLVQHLARLNRPFDTAFGEVWLAGSYQLHRRHTLALEHAQLGFATSQQHGLGTWLPAAWMQILIAQAAMGSAEATTQLAQAHQQFMAAGAELSATFYAWAIARGKMAAGQNAEARSAVQDGLARAESGRETYLHAELLVLRGQLNDDDSGARADFHAARQVADRQGAPALALRALAHDVLRAGAADDDATQARSVLDTLDGALVDGLPPGWVAAALKRLQEANIRPVT